MKFADITNDIAFKIIFGDENRKVVLISFLNAVLDLEEDHKIVDVTILNPFQLPLFKDGKATIIDVKAKDQKGRYYVVEMQVSDSQGFSKRVLYYTSQGYVSQIERGEFYDRLNPTIFIGILDFNLTENSKYLSRHRILDVETGERVIKEMEFNFIELPKFNLKLEELKSPLEKWIFFINEGEHQKVIPEGMEDPGLKTAFESANIWTWSKNELEEYDHAGMCETHYRLIWEKAVSTAFEKGRLEGKLQVKRERAKAMKEKGLTSSVIAGLTGLTEEEVIDL